MLQKISGEYWNRILARCHNVNAVQYYNVLATDTLAISQNDIGSVYKIHRLSTVVCTPPTECQYDLILICLNFNDDQYYPNI